MSKVFERGDRVKTPLGNGSIIYCRMSGPSYTRASIYSVCLDSKKDVFGYGGTVIPAEEVTEECP